MKPTRFPNGISGAITNAPAAGAATAGAITMNAIIGKVTTEALTTAQNTDYTLTITNNQVTAADVVVASLAWGTNSQATPVITRVTPGAGTITVIVRNMHSAATALDGTLVISFEVTKAA